MGLFADHRLAGNGALVDQLENLTRRVVSMGRKNPCDDAVFALDVLDRLAHEILGGVTPEFNEAYRDISEQRNLARALAPGAAS